MSNTITIKHGEQAPGTSQLADFEFGYCTGDGKLYFNAAEKMNLTNVKLCGKPFQSKRLGIVFIQIIPN